MLTPWCHLGTRNLGKGDIMGSLDREQLEVLRRQIEEDYRLDMSAIERLQRRFMPSGSGVSPVSNVASIEKSSPVLSSIESSAEPQPDDLTNTLRGMFSSHRR